VPAPAPAWRPACAPGGPPAARAHREKAEETWAIVSQSSGRPDTGAGRRRASRSSPPDLERAMRLVLVSLALLTLTPLAPGAPAPTKRNDWVRSPTPADMRGRWVMVWGDAEAAVALSASHDYRCNFQGQEYVGSWYFDEHGDLLITEARTDG